MKTAKIIRQDCNLFNGKKTEKSVFVIKHKSKRTIEKIIKILKDSNSISNDDIIQYDGIQTNTKSSQLCFICVKNPVGNDRYRCDKCTNVISSVINDPHPNAKFYKY